MRTINATVPNPLAASRAKPRASAAGGKSRGTKITSGERKIANAFASGASGIRATRAKRSLPPEKRYKISA